METESRYIGKPVSSINGAAVISGQTVYCRDLTMPNMLYAKVLRSPHPYAKILSIDTSEAEKLEGIVAVATARDIHGINSYGIPVSDQPVLVPEGGFVRMVGDNVALVAAETAESAEKALGLIHVEYEIYKPALDYEEADLDPNAHYQGEYHYDRGDVETGFEEADLVLEKTFYTPRQEHAFLEPEGGLAYLDIDGTIVIYAGLQEPYRIRYFVGRTLGINEHRVRAIIPQVGGSFGGKQSISVHIHIALMALKTGRPVRMLWSREESLKYHPKRHPARLNCKIGFGKEGKILAYQVDGLFNGGAYAHQSPGVIAWGGMHACGPYRIPNIKISGRVIQTNTPPSGAFRGFGGPKYVIVHERLMDIAAKELGIDPVKIRLNNALAMGDKIGADGVVLDTKVSMPEALKKALEIAGTAPKSDDPNKLIGRGVACGMPFFDISSTECQDVRGTGAEIEISRNGEIEARVGVVEYGCGITTTLSQIVAEEFNTDISRIRIVCGDSRLTPKSGPTVGSRSTYCCGNALIAAANELKERLKEKAGQLLGLPAHVLAFENDGLYAKDNPDIHISMSDLCYSCYFEGVNMKAYSWFVGKHADSGHTFLAHVTDVEIDKQTCEITIKKLVTVHDAGKVINPIGYAGQIYGGALQTIGYALSEDMLTDEKGAVTAAILGDYLIPTSLDVPTELPYYALENPYPTGPFGAKGVGEHASFASAGSIMNAISNALGKEVYRLPVTKDQIWNILYSSKK